MNSMERFLLEVEVLIESDWYGVLFTGKLVKSLLIDANPRLKPLFEKSSGAEPKLIHITPLYARNKNGIKCIYSYVKQSEKTEKEGEKVKVRINGVYRFYVGFVDGLDRFDGENVLSFDRIYNTLLDINGKHLFRHHKFHVELISINILDVDSHVRRTIRELKQSKKTEIKNSYVAKQLEKTERKNGKVKIIFSSPTMLRDPLRNSKHKSLIPTPMNIFSTPVYINLYLSGRLRRKTLLKTLVLLHRVLNEPYSVHKTTSIKWVLYNENKHPIPALVGYVNLYLNRAYYEEYAKKYDIETLLYETFSTIITLGTGTSRATGFGHVIVKTNNNSDGRLPMRFDGFSSSST